MPESIHICTRSSVIYIKVLCTYAAVDIIASEEHTAFNEIQSFGGNKSFPTDAHILIYMYIRR